MAEFQGLKTYCFEKCDQIVMIYIVIILNMPNLCQSHTIVG